MSTSTPVAEEAHRLIGRAIARLMNSDTTKAGTPERAHLVETIQLLYDAMGLLSPHDAHPEDIPRHLEMIAQIERAGRPLW